MSNQLIAIRAKFETIRSLAHGSITTSYVIVGTAFTHLLRMFRVVNATNGDLLISLDGTNDHIFVPASSYVLYDLAANRTPANGFFIDAGTAFYTKYVTDPSSGTVYVEGVYAK